MVSFSVAAQSLRQKIHLSKKGGVTVTLVEQLRHKGLPAGEIIYFILMLVGLPSLGLLYKPNTPTLLWLSKVSPVVILFSVMGFTLFKRQVYDLVTGLKLLGVSFSWYGFKLTLRSRSLLHILWGAFSEELAFRGTILTCILLVLTPSSPWRAYGAIAIQAIIFAFYHLIVGSNKEKVDVRLTGRPRLYAHFRLLFNNFLGGLLYGIIFIWSGSIYLSWCSHIFNNTVDFLRQNSIVKIGILVDGDPNKVSLDTRSSIFVRNAAGREHLIRTDGRHIQLVQDFKLATEMSFTTAETIAEALRKMYGVKETVDIC